LKKMTFAIKAIFKLEEATVEGIELVEGLEAV
jgi:hypothetical protein